MKHYGNLEMTDELNLSEKEVEELRKQKYELSEYAREKIRELMNAPFTAFTKDGKLRFYVKGKEVLTLAKECMIRYDEALKKLAQ